MPRASRVPPGDHGLAYAAVAVLAVFLVAIAFVALAPRSAPEPPAPRPCTANTDSLDFFAIRWDRDVSVDIAYASDRDGNGVYDANDDLAFWWWFRDQTADARAVTDARVDDGRTGSVNEALDLLEDDLASLVANGQVNARQQSCGFLLLQALR